MPLSLKCIASTSDAIFWGGTPATLFPVVQPIKDVFDCRVLSEDVRLMLWDTAGQEEFDAITKAYYRGAQACVIAFSTTDRASFDAVKKWKRKVEDECGHIPMVMVQNKIDLLHESQVDK